MSNLMIMVLFNKIKVDIKRVKDFQIPILQENLILLLAFTNLGLLNKM